MSTGIVDMDSKRPHIVEAMRCRKCSHEFTSVHLASIASENWQCPECGEMSCAPFTDDGLLGLDRDELREIVREVRGARDAIVTMYNAELERCGEYLKEGETPSQCIKRNRDDANAVLGMLAAERKKVEELRSALTDAQEVARRGDEIILRLDQKLAAAHSSLTARDDLLRQVGIGGPFHLVAVSGDDADAWYEKRNELLGIKR